MTSHNSQARLDMVYDGPALADGSMNVRDLAPAMMAVGSFFDAANRVANGERSKVSVNVRATSAGSFQVLFEVVQNVEAVGILDIGDILATASNLKALLIGGSPGAAGGVFWLIKRLRGRKPQVTKIDDSRYELTVDDETYEAPIELLRLYRDVAVRRNIQDMLNPVKEPGIDRFMLRDAGRTVEEVTKEDVGAFEAPDDQELILDEVRRQAFSIVSLTFKENNKWRLTDGQNTISVAMNDGAFQNRVDNNEVVFAKGDVLLCDLRTIQWQVEDGVKSEYEVVRVVKHRTARQLMLLE